MIFNELTARILTYLWANCLKCIIFNRKILTIMRTSLFNLIKFSLLSCLLTIGVNCNPQTREPKQQPGEPRQTTMAEQSQLIKKILSGYNASKLNADDAKAIHVKFREAGIHAGPENDAAIKAAGFDPEQLKKLAPPPNLNIRNKPEPPPLEERLKVVSEKICKPLSLTAIQQESVQRAFADFYTEMDQLRNATGDRQSPPDKSKVDPLEKARNAKIQQLISAEKFKQFLELEKESRPARPDGDERKR